MVWAAELRSKEPIFIVGGSVVHPTYHCTIAALRRGLPQLFARSFQDMPAAHLRAYLESVRSEVDAILAEKFAEDVRPVLNEVQGQMVQVEKVFNEHESRLLAVERQVTTIVLDRPRSPSDKA